MMIGRWDKNKHIFTYFFPHGNYQFIAWRHDKCHLHEMLFPNLKKTVASGILWIKIKKRILTFPTGRQKGINREFKIRRLRTTATDKYATAHDQNHVTVHFSRVVLRLRWVVELFRVVGTTENILLVFCRLGDSRISSFLKKVFNSPALSETEAKYVSCV